MRRGPPRPPPRPPPGGIARAKARARNGCHPGTLLTVRAPAGFPDQRREQIARGGIARDELFGMPLHADDEAVAVRQLDALDDPVGGPGNLAEAAAERLDRLVVHAVHLELERAEDLAEACALAHHLHGVRGLVAWLRLAVRERLARRIRGVAVLIRDVLVEAPAQRDVDDLDAAADGEEGHVVVERPMDDADPESVTRPGDFACGVVALVAEARGVDVAAAREDEAVEALPEHTARGPAELPREQQA